MLSVIQQPIRSGECNRCGSCCVDDVRDTERATGLKQSVEGYCVYFRWSSPGIGECVGRDSAYYLSGCNSWPASSKQIASHPLCSYTFGV